MDEQARESAFMSALVTEHFVLQSAASTTVSEATGRASLYLSVLSSSLVAMGFAAQTDGVFTPFAAAVIPAILVTGVFTVVRLVDTGVQNLMYLSRIARIRAHYRTLGEHGAAFFGPWGAAELAEGDEALATLTLTRRRLTGLFTTASMIAAINSMVAGAGAALACVRALGRDRLWLAIPAALAVVAVCMLAFYRYQDNRYQAIHFVQR